MYYEGREERGVGKIGDELEDIPWAMICIIGAVCLLAVVIFVCIAAKFYNGPNKKSNSRRGDIENSNRSKDPFYQNKDKYEDKSSNSSVILDENDKKIADES